MAVTPNYSWPIPVATDYVKDGYDAIADLGNAIDTTVAGLGTGLTLIKTQTVGTAVSTVEVTGAFSTNYNAYKIVYSGGVTSTNAILRLQMGATTTGYYGTYFYGDYEANTIFGSGTNNSSSWNYLGYGTTTAALISSEIINPFETSPTFYSGMFINPITNADAGITTGFLNNSTSYTAFTILTSTGTLTGGTIRVYGYQK